MYGTVSCPGCPDPVFCPVYGFWNLHIIRDFWMQFNPEQNMCRFRILPKIAHIYEYTTPEAYQVKGPVFDPCMATVSKKLLFKIYL